MSTITSNTRKKCSIIQFVCWSCVVEQAGLKLKGEHQEEGREKRENQQGGRWGGAQGVHPCQGEERASNRQPQPCRAGTVHHRLQNFLHPFCGLVALCSLAWLFGPLLYLILLGAFFFRSGGRESVRGWGCCRPWSLAVTRLILLTTK